MPKGVEQKGAEHQYDPSNPLIVQGDRSILVEVDNPRYAEARDALAPFAELEKSPEHIHTYRLTPLSLWNAAAAGHTAEAMIDVLRRFSKFPLPANLAPDIAERRQPLWPGQASSATIRPAKGRPRSASSAPTRRCSKNWPASPRCATTSANASTRTSFLVDPAHRGVLKQALIAVGYPAEDLAGYTEGAALADEPADDLPQRSALHRPRLPARGRPTSSTPAATCAAASGVIVLPCGAGKTIVGIAAMALMQRSTLVLTTGITAVKQWRREILDKTDLHRGPGRRVHRRDQGNRPGHAGHLPDPHAPQRQDRGVSPLQTVRQARLGPDHLRRGASAARPGLPRHGPDPGPPPARV